MTALVVFCEASGHWLGWALKPGFRHVYVIVRTGGFWVSLDPAIGVPRLEVLANADHPLAEDYRAAGLTVVETTIVDRPARWPLAVANCVGVVKAVLGLRRAWIVTPFQLYRHLTRT